MQISIVRNYLDYKADEALVLTINRKAACNEAYDLTSMLACGGMLHFRAVELFRRYPNIKTAVVRPLIDGVNEARNIVFVRDDIMSAPLAITIERALSRAHRSGFKRVVIPLVRFNWFVKDNELVSWMRDYLQAVLDCRARPDCQVTEVVIVASDDPNLHQMLQQTLKELIQD